MSEAMPGRCLCGTVTFSAVPEKVATGACHCSKCRKWSGGVLFGVECSELNVNNPDAVQGFQSSEWGERLFCKNCGTNLFWQTLDRTVNVVLLQAFDEPEKFEFTDEMFIDEKPANYTFANETKKITGEEFMAMYAPEG